jgi:hypothetical protein
MQIAMTFTTGLWRLPPEYLSQRADIGAAAVFRHLFPVPSGSGPGAEAAPSANAAGLAAICSSSHLWPPAAWRAPRIIALTSEVSLLGTPLMRR